MLFSNILRYNKLEIIQNCQTEKSNLFASLEATFLFPQLVTITQIEALVKKRDPHLAGDNIDFIYSKGERACQVFCGFVSERASLPFAE